MKFEYIISIPKSLYVSLKLFKFRQAIKIPIVVRFNVKLSSLSGIVYVESENVKFAMLRIGFGDIGVLDKTYQRTILKIDGILSISNDAFIGQGARISIGKLGKLHFGNNFRNSGGMTIMCEDNISFGDNCLVSWNTTIMDSDYHPVIDLSKSVIKRKSKPIIIGNNVWLGLGSLILKGVTIESGCIVASSAVVSRKFLNKNTLIAGSPASEKACNVTRYIE